MRRLGGRRDRVAVQPSAAGTAWGDDDFPIPAVVRAATLDPARPRMGVTRPSVAWLADGEATAPLARAEAVALHHQPASVFHIDVDGAAHRDAAWPDSIGHRRMAYGPGWGIYLVTVEDRVVWAPPGAVSWLGREKKTVGDARPTVSRDLFRNRGFSFRFLLPIGMKPGVLHEPPRFP